MHVQQLAVETCCHVPAVQPVQKLMVARLYTRSHTHANMLQCRSVRALLVHPPYALPQSKHSV